MKLTKKMVLELITKKLLSINNNQDRITLIKFALEDRTDWKIFIASIAIEEIEQPKSNQPDTILLDLMIPNRNGMHICKMLKSNPFICKIPNALRKRTQYFEVIRSPHLVWAGF